jgi:putative copper export protein
MDIGPFSQPSNLAPFEDVFRFVSFTIVRFCTFCAHAFLFGLVPVALLVLRPSFSSLRGEFGDKARRRLSLRLEGLVRASLLASLIATIIAILLQAVLVSEVSGGEVGSSSFSAALSTSFGRWFALRIPILGGLAVLLVNRLSPSLLAGAGDDRRAPTVAWWATWGVLAAVLLSTSSFAGHAAVAQPLGLSLANDVIHLFAGAIWFCGIVVLAIGLPDAWRGESSNRVRVLAPVVVRFSTVAAASVAVLAITGTLNSFLHVGNLSDLISTSYGRTLLLKIGLFMGVLVLGGVNHYWVREKLRKAAEANASTNAPAIFRKTIAVELIIALLLMGMTGMLVGLGRTRVTGPATSPSSPAARS